MLRLSTQRLVAYPQTTPGQKVQPPVGLAKKIHHAPPISNVDATALTRREWLAAVRGGALLPAATGAMALGPQDAPTANPAVHAEFPSHDPAVVREVVGASHVRIDRVRELVEASPALAKAAWDWGFGDWESALGAASHMGRRDIAELLMTHGARPNLFTFAMLGHLEAVQATVQAVPGIQRTPGPHGITLLQHARNGHQPAEAVVEYLQSLGDADAGPTSLELSDEQKQSYIGRYVFGSGPDDAFEVLTNRRGLLAIKRGDRFSRVLNRVEEHAFAPSGAPEVRVRFQIDNGRAVSLTVHDPVPLIRATRAG